MTSAALREWETARADRIAELLAAHASVGGEGKGRRYRTEQLNWALTLRVAGEFQGYCRSLHDLAVDDLASRTAQLNFPVGATLRRIMTNGRKLDRGNPSAGNLGSDFGLLGMDFWPSLKKRYPANAQKAQDKLELLVEARNGIAHSDVQTLAALKARGCLPGHLQTVRSWRGWMNRLAGMMDTTVAEYIGNVFGGAPPW